MLINIGLLFDRIFDRLFDRIVDQNIDQLFTRILAGLSKGLPINRTIVRLRQRKLLTGNLSQSVRSFPKPLAIPKSFPHNRGMNTMNVDSPAARTILNPNPLLGRKDENGNHVVLVRTEIGGGYISVADMVSLAQQGVIQLVDVDSTGLSGQYGRTRVAYKIV